MGLRIDLGSGPKALACIGAPADMTSPELAYGTVTVVANGTASCTFGTPYAATANSLYSVSLYDTAGAGGTNCYFTDTHLPAVPFVGGSTSGGLIWVYLGVYDFGGPVPPNNPGTSTLPRGIEPIY